LKCLLDGEAYAANPGLPEARYAAERDLTTSQFQAYRAQRSNLQASVSERQAELGTVESSIAPLAENARIAIQRAEDYARLLKEGTMWAATTSSCVSRNGLRRNAI